MGVGIHLKPQIIHIRCIHCCLYTEYLCTSTEDKKKVLISYKCFCLKLFPFDYRFFLPVIFLLIAFGKTKKKSKKE